MMQISVDRMTLLSITKKSFKRSCRSLIISRIPKSACTSPACFVRTRCRNRKRYGNRIVRGIPTEVRLVHADPQRFALHVARRKNSLNLSINDRAKRRGEKIHTNEAILHYQKAFVQRTRGGPATPVTTFFFVSAQGKF